MLGWLAGWLFEWLAGIGGREGAGRLLVDSLHVAACKLHSTACKATAGRPLTPCPSSSPALSSSYPALSPCLLPCPAQGFGLASEHARHVRGSAAAAFHAELAEAVAYGMGARCGGGGV